MSTVGAAVSERSYAGEPLTHHHDFYQVIIAEQGRLDLLVAGRRGYAGGGQYVFLEPGLEHTCWSLGDNRFLVLDLSAEMVEDTRRRKGLRSRVGADVFRPVDQRVISLSAVLRTELSWGGLRDRLVAETLGLYAATVFLDSSQSPEHAGLSPSQRLIGGRVKEYLEAHYTQDVSLDSVAKAAGASAAHVHRCFRKLTGMSIVEYLHALRIERAQLLLKTTEMSILEVASAVGFSNQSYFARLFARKVGMTPSRYRAGRFLVSRDGGSGSWQR